MVRRRAQVVLEWSVYDGPRGPAHLGGTGADDELLSFLVNLGREVENAMRARKALLSDLLVARRDPTSALDLAGRASRRCVRAFDDALLHLRWARVPRDATECVTELRRWLEAHVDACDHLARAAAARDRADLDRAIRCLAAGDLHAHGYNAARERLARRLAAASN